MAVLLTIAMMGLITGAIATPSGIAQFFLLQAIVGAIVGIAVGRLVVLALNRLHLEYDGLYPVVTLSVVLITYAIAVPLGGSGFLAVYLAVLIMGKYDFVHKRSLIAFHDGVSWVMQIAMFLVLGLLVFPSHLVPVMGSAFLLALFLVFVARPVAVLLTTPFSRLSLGEKGFLGWVGLKGATPIIIATFPLLAGIPQADLLFNVVFFVVLTSVIIQGTSIPLVARLLRTEEMARPAEPAAVPDIVYDRPSVSAEKSELQEYEVHKDSPLAGKQIVEAGLPRNALVLAVHRNDRQEIPTGSTQLLPGDRLIMLIEDEAVAPTQALLRGNSNSSAPPSP